MAKPLLWPARSHPRASYMSAGASWPRRRRRAGARRAGGRASQSRRPTPPPTAPPAPNGAGPGGGEHGRPPPPPPFPCSQHPRPAAPWGLSPPGRCTPLRGGDGKIEGVPPRSAGMRNGEGGGQGGSSEDGVREGLGDGADSSGCCPAAEPRLPAPPPGCPGLEIGTGEINMLKSLKSGSAARSRERDKPQRGHVSLK